MNTFNKKSLYTAIAGLSALGVTGIAEAVFVNPEGLGQVVIYPYYTARTRSDTATIFPNTQNNTLLSVVNSTASAKAVKVRFLENVNSREVLDFNLYLSAKDVWTAAVIPTSDGAGIVTFDKSCTSPVVSSNTASPTPFVNFAYSGTNADGGDTSLDRTREGYIEIIEMGDVITDSPTWTLITHVAGVPPCNANALAAPTTATDTVTGSGGLFGDLTIINVNASAMIAMEAVALANFNTLGTLWNVPASINPTLASGSVTTSETFKGGAVTVATWGTSIDAVSASMMHDNVMNEYILDSGTSSGTDWVVTYPTKRFYVAVGTGTPPLLFQRNFNGGTACDDVAFPFWDREEQVAPGVPPGFSPPPPGAPSRALCYEANVITFNNSNVLASAYSHNFNVGFENGWANLGMVGGALAPIHTLVATSGQTFFGLPVVGFAVSTFFNGNIPLAGGGTIQSAYAGAYKHKPTSN